MNRHIFTYRIDWQGIAIDVSYEPNWLGGDHPVFTTAHLQVCSTAPERAPLPVTETGYRSRFLPASAVVEAGGPVAYVRAWLDHEAALPAWRQRADAARQMTLF